ncbi:hypothetical protein [Nocardioides sp. Iso805N]|uniref:hypothetical protein n=1 Tax=Nocardioides sp. Iso805N TaxID=1283287 RepID=UPI0003627F32|nr:hypothetical protein [Nocardioides sp. Iso805N]
MTYCYNFFGIDRFFVRAGAPVPPGEHELRFEFDYDDGGLAKGGEVTLFLDGEAIGSGRVEHTEPGRFSADETCDLGVDLGSVVSTDYQPGRNAFTGAVAWAQIDVGDLDPEHQALEHQIHLAVAHGTQ